MSTALEKAIKRAGRNAPPRSKNGNGNGSHAVAVSRTGRGPSLDRIREIRAEDPREFGHIVGPDLRRVRW